jgi:hypothetical protein
MPVRCYGTINIYFCDHYRTSSESLLFEGSVSRSIQNLTVIVRTLDPWPDHYHVSQLPSVPDLVTHSQLAILCFEKNQNGGQIFPWQEKTFRFPTKWYFLNILHSHMKSKKAKGDIVEDSNFSMYLPTVTS